MFAGADERLVPFVSESIMHKMLSVVRIPSGSFLITVKGITMADRESLKKTLTIFKSAKGLPRLWTNK
jgi:hypothetical protein